MLKNKPKVSNLYHITSTRVNGVALNSIFSGERIPREEGRGGGGGYVNFPLLLNWIKLWAVFE